MINVPLQIFIEYSDAVSEGDEGDNYDEETSTETAEPELSEPYTSIPKRLSQKKQYRVVVEGLDLTNICLLQAHAFG